jgi:hypothetical protein
MLKLIAVLVAGSLLALLVRLAAYHGTLPTIGETYTLSQGTPIATTQERAEDVAISLRARDPKAHMYEGVVTAHQGTRVLVLDVQDGVIRVRIENCVAFVPIEAWPRE